MFGISRITKTPSPRKALFAATALLLGACAVSFADGPSLTPSQRQRAQSLYTLFIAPCCWRQSVAEHQSAQAIYVRHEIDQSVLAGKNDDEIKQALVQEYGHGILMNPEGVRGIIAYGGPLLALFAGIIITVRWIRGSVRQHVNPEPL